jgi:hypothetical protein
MIYGFVLHFEPISAKKVYLTDLEEFTELARENVAENGMESTCECHELDWRSEKIPDWAKDPDIVVFSDCVYYEDVRKL